MTRNRGKPMNGEDREQQPILDSWVERTLDLSADASPAERQREILKRLEDVQFHPGFYEASALQVYFDQQLSEIAKWQSCARLLREDLAKFKIQFFDLTPAERRHRFDKLNRDVEYFPALRKHLERLKPILNFERETLEVLRPETRDLGSFLMELVEEEPAAVPFRKREFRYQAQFDPSDWKRLVNELKQRAPGLIDTEKQWLHSLTASTKQKNKLARLSTSESESGSGEHSRNGWAIALVIIVVVRILSAIATSSREDSSSNYRPPQVDLPNHSMTSDQIQDILDSMSDSLPPPTVPDLEIESDSQEFQSLREELDALPEYGVLRLDSLLFKITKEREKYFIVFEEARYLSDIATLSRIENPEQSFLFNQMQNDYQQFQLAARLVKEFQNDVYVTYEAAVPGQRHGIPSGTILKHLRGGSPIVSNPLGGNLPDDSRWRNAYRYRKELSSEER